jgi:molybdopterin/thiamine biosynthesis adenylyltransferase
MISEHELSRYERQIMIPGWGKEGQQKLKEAKVLVAGAGGLGSPVAIYLAVAGVGRIRIIDGDEVELGNLNRQILYSDRDLGRKKADCAKERLEALNSDISVEAIGEIITEENVFDLVSDYAIVDAMDNLPTRYLLNDVALKRRLPLFHGAVYGFEGRATTIVPGKTACLRCLYQGVVPGKTPVPGVTPAVIGCIQAAEVIKYFLGMGELLCDRLLIYDGLAASFRELKLKRDPRCEACGAVG